MSVLGLGAPGAGAMTSQPNDPGLPLQWNLQMIGAPQVWPVATGTGITIAIVDSGVDLGHEDLRTKVIGHATCVGSNGDVTKCDGSGNAGQDDNGHGTHVAGIAAAATDNGLGVAGVAPDASILDVKVLAQSCDPLNGCDATGSADDVAAGIKYAADHGAAVINLSLGNASQSVIGPAFQSAIDYAFNKGAIPVISAGNNYVLPSGGALNAIVVGALARDGTKASYANSIGDAQWGLMAPGGEPDTAAGCQSHPIGVLSTYLNGYACLAGTSMAAPHVAGAAAILRSMGVSQKDTISRLLGTARKIAPAAVYGAGALDLAAAAGVTATTTTAPPVTTPDQGSQSTGEPAPGGITSSSSAPPTNSSSSVAPAPPGDLSGPTATAPAGVITLPGQRAAGPPPGGVVTRTAPSKGAVSTGLVAFAVVMAAGVSAAVGWFFLGGSHWARRTPRRPRDQ
ncbi:MAG TPA: S8 family serine peptidase [Acidimicrobiales bacterium]|jgi:subtilisin family serine protease|nr:S8 family serine peptidase [Acidimicrobiales bacterium]